MTESPETIAPDLDVPLAELELSFIRASGPGGQNVNKVASAVQLRFDAGASPAVSPDDFARLRRLAGRRMTAGGVIVITARRFRSQERNRDDAIARLTELLRAARVRRKSRRPTRPGRAVRERRIAEKKQRGRIKRLRGRSVADDA